MPHAGGRLSILALVALLIAFALQCVASMRLKSATFDEPTYLAAGYVALTTGVDLNPAHPPLMKYLLAVPLALVGTSPASAIPHWSEALAKPRTYGVSFLFENRVDADTLLFAGRCAVVALSVLLGLLVWQWARELYGPVAGTVAVACYAFCPNLIAHSSVATLDLGMTAGVAAASYAFWRAYRRPTPLAGILAGTALAVALLMKTTALLILGLLPLLLTAAVLWHRQGAAVPAAQPPSTKRRGAVAARPSATRALLLATGVALLVAVSVISVAYGPHRFGLAAYFVGFRHGVLNRAAFMTQGYEAFCWGRYSATGFWWYFLAAFLLKTPIPTLLATGATIVWLARRPAHQLFNELFLVLPIVAFFVATAVASDDLGVRYILPVYPLLYVLIGGMAAEIFEWMRQADTRRARLAAAIGGTFALAYVGGTLAVFPSYLAFFNGLFCLPGNGIRYLDDSNIDWGQDFKPLARYVHEHEIHVVKGMYYPPHLQPLASRYYGLTLQTFTVNEIVDPEPGWYAVSAQVLQRPWLSDDPRLRDLRFDWLDRFTPVAKIGYSIYLYHFD